MTLAELADSLPNGFHDSALKGFSVDYGNRIARMEFSLMVGQPDDPAGIRDNCRDATIELLGMRFLLVSAPDANESLDCGTEVWIVDGYETDEILSYCKELDPKLLQSFTPDVFAFSFYVNDWNSYIHVAAKDCKMQWVGAVHAYAGKRQRYYPGETVDLS